MSDSYQAIYDAVRSRISGGNIADAVTEVARSALSALKAHDDALWNEALTTGIEWQATRGHTLDADDYGNELRSLKR